MWCLTLLNTINEHSMNTYYIPDSLHLGASSVQLFFSLSHLPTLMNVNLISRKALRGHEAILYHDCGDGCLRVMNLSKRPELCPK